MTEIPVDQTRYVAVFFKTFLLVGLNCCSIDLNLKVNTSISSSANQIIPGVFMVKDSSSFNSSWHALSAEGILRNTACEHVSQLSAITQTTVCIIQFL